MIKTMRTFFDWVNNGNRWKYLCCGMVLGVCSGTMYCAALSGIATAGALQYKNYAWGGSCSTVNAILMAAGSVVGYLIRCALCGR
jgi:hypothetical protein